MTARTGGSAMTTRTRRAATTVQAGVSLLVAGLALAACGSSQGSRLKLRVTRTNVTSIAPAGSDLQPGDSFIASSKIAGGGHAEAYCVISERRHTDLCTVTVLLRRGQFSAEGIFVNAPKLSGTIALLSGSGAYRGASGDFTTSGLTDRNESITIRMSRG